MELTVCLIAPTLEHLPELRALLTQSGLPTAGLEAQFPSGYVILQHEHVAIGLAGLEHYGRVGLLRSVVVATTHRGRGLGRLLVANRLQAARRQGVERVFLLTTSAERYFGKLGFVPAARSEAPDALVASAEFAHACPASAACLARMLR